MVKLTASNYAIWKPRMEDVLCCRDLYDPVEGDEAKPSSMSEADWKRLKRKAVGFIRQFIDNSIFHRVSEETDAKVLWDKLKSLYERKTSLIKRLVYLRFRVYVQLQHFQ